MRDPSAGITSSVPLNSQLAMRVRLPTPTGRGRHCRTFIPAKASRRRAEGSPTLGGTESQRLLQDLLSEFGLTDIDLVVNGCIGGADSSSGAPGDESQQGCGEYRRGVGASIDLGLDPQPGGEATEHQSIDRQVDVPQLLTHRVEGDSRQRRMLE